VLRYWSCNFVTECTVSEEKETTVEEQAVAGNNIDAFEEQRYAVFE
jgi:hypothetical protein